MVTFELEQFAVTANGIWQKAREENRLTHNPSDKELRGLVEKEPGVRKTMYGNFRGPLIPAISKLTREQAAASMVLGQAMESSAGDPTRAGAIRSEFFYDPFVAGDRRSMLIYFMR